MNMNQFTQKSLAAIQSAQDLAVEYEIGRASCRERV